MIINKAIGRQPKVTMRTVVLLADAIAHNTNISDSCRFVGISRSTFYFYLKNNQVFAEKMATAKDNQSKLVSFLTIY